MHDMTPINRTRYRRATPPATNQNKTIRPDMPRMSAHELCQVIRIEIRSPPRYSSEKPYSQFFLAHQRVNRKNTAKTMEAILLAFVLNPQAIKHAPMKEDPRYPAGRVNDEMPPDILVAPPSSAAHHCGVSGFQSLE